MNCQQLQASLSLYLYGELEFAREEELEQHLLQCAFCQAALAREKSWHTTVNSERTDVPLDFLAQCRRDLRVAVKESASKSYKKAFWSEWNWFGFGVGQWSTRLALASFFVFVGFTLSHSIEQGTVFTRTLDMGVLGSPASRVRDIQQDGDRIRIVVDQVQQRQIVGSLSDRDVRELILAAAKDPSDPGLRVDSVEVLTGQGGSDIRDALLSSARSDENPAVRMKALAGLNRFAGDRSTRDTLVYVLQHDTNPAVRSQAIDLLVPSNSAVQVSPDLAGALEQIIQSEQSDDYVRARAIQSLALARTLGGSPVR